MKIRDKCDKGGEWRFIGNILDRGIFIFCYGSCDLNNLLNFFDIIFLYTNRYNSCLEYFVEGKECFLGI